MPRLRAFRRSRPRCSSPDADSSDRAQDIADVTPAGKMIWTPLDGFQASHFSLGCDRRGRRLGTPASAQDTSPPLEGCAGRELRCPCGEKEPTQAEVGAPRRGAPSLFARRVGQPPSPAGRCRSTSRAAVDAPRWRPPPFPFSASCGPASSLAGWVPFRQALGGVLCIFTLARPPLLCGA